MATDSVGLKNGNYFGLGWEVQESEIVILPAPWDVTTSYQDGTSRGPKAILDASSQIDYFSPYRSKAWETRIGTLKAPAHWLSLNGDLRSMAKQIIAALESGQNAPEALLAKVNQASATFHQELYAQALAQLKAGKKLVTLGGDHSVSYGPILAHGEIHGAFSVLHFDAHADLRVAYEGFEHSHASIMDHVVQMPFVKSLVQVGLRDVSPEEMARTEQDPKIHAFFDWDLHRSRAKGINWKAQCAEIIQHLGEKVYVSFDVDGLDPKFCPSTGTPVPGGLELADVFFLLEELERSGRKIIGADLVEVAPSPQGEWDANVGARILFQLCQFLRQE